MRSAGVWRVLVLVVLVLVGGLVATAARWAAGTDVRAERRTELVDVIRAEQARVAVATAELAQLQRAVLDASQDQAPVLVDADLEELVAEVSGPGVEVVLSDAPVPAEGVPEGYSADDFVVHEQDVHAVVNALWAGGAEAVAVMDQRIIATSAIRCVGSTLLLHGQVYAPPYRVSAVGPADRMVRALDASPRVTLYRQYAELLGLGFEVQEQASVTVPAYAGPITARYADVTG